MAKKTYSGGYIPIEELEEEIYTGGYVPIIAEEEEKKYIGGYEPIKMEIPAIKPLEKDIGKQMFTPVTKYAGGYVPIIPLEEPTDNEIKVRQFQEQWRKDHPIKIEYGNNDYTPVSYFGAGFHKSVQYDLEDWKPMPYKTIEKENEEFKGIANNILRNYLQRGNWAAANVADRIAKGDYGDIFSAAWKGLSGQEQRYFSDVLKGAGVDNTEAGILGFVLDVGLDPVNYVPLGAAIRATKKGISKTDLFKEMAKTGFVKNLQKIFSAGQGMPKELYKFIKYRGRDLDAKQWKVVEKTKKLFKGTTKSSREMMSRVRKGQIDVNKLNPREAYVYDSIVNKLRAIGKEAVDVKLISKDAYLKNIDDYIHGFYRGRTKLGGLTGRAGKAAFRKPKVWESPVDQYDWAMNLKNAMAKIDEVEPIAKSKFSEIFTSPFQKMATDGKKIYINPDIKWKTIEDINKFLSTYKGRIEYKDYERARQIILKTVKGATQHEIGHAFSDGITRTDFGAKLYTEINTIFNAEQLAIKSGKKLGKPALMAGYQKLRGALNIASEEIPNQYALYKLFPDIQKKYYPEIFNLFQKNKNIIRKYDLPVEILTKGIPKRLSTVEKARKLAVESGFVEDASTMTLKEIKSGVKNIKLAELDFLKSSALREIEQIREVGRITMVNESMRTFGKPLPKGLKALPDDVAVYIPRGTVPDMFLKETDEMAKGIRALLDNVKKDLVEIPVDVAQALKARRGAPKAYMVPKEIAHHLNLIGDYLTPGGEEFNLVMKGLDSVQGLWKGLVTAVRPSFHVRNATSNVFLAWLSGINAIDLLPRHAGAIRMAKKSLNKIDTNMFGKLRYSQIEDVCKQTGAAGRGWMGAAEPHKVWNAFEDLFDPKISLRKFKKLSPIQLGRTAGQAIEDCSRRAIFLDEIVKSNKRTLGAAAIDAAERVGRFAYDYDELALFEKKFMKRGIPFYTWMRKNIPNMFNQLLEQPDKFSKIGKLKRIAGVKETEAEKALKPDWMAEEGYMKSPFKMKGKPVYYYMDLPTKDLETLFSMRDLYSSITPFKEIPHMLLNVKSFPELGARIAEEGKEYTAAPAWMTFLPEKVKDYLKIGPGIDLSTGKEVLKIHKKVLYAMETFMPPIKDLNSTSNLIYPQPVEYLKDKALYRMYSHPTGMQFRALDLDWETQNIVREMQEMTEKIHAIATQRTDYMDTTEYNNALRRLEELEDRLNRAQKKE